HHIYTLTLAGLSSKNAGFYWCQLEIAEEKESNAAARNLLPSDKCRVGVDDKLVGCEYGEHKDEWKCAQTLATVTNEDSEDVDAYGSRAPELLATVQRPSPTVTLHDTSGRKTPPIKMQWTVMEVVLFVVVLLCVAIIVLLLVCVFIKRKRKRADPRTPDTTIVLKQFKNSSDKEASAIGHARYTPVSTLTRTHPIPQLASEWCKSSSTLQKEDPIYSSPYQHLNTTSMDYTNMYSKLHQ
ncbi:hypothetical protein GBAR_LOCUS29009, partial [Geodia barretti]